VQAPSGCGNSKSVVPGLTLAVPLVIEQQQRRGEKNLLRLSRGNPMTLVLAGIPAIPFELGNRR